MKADEYDKLQIKFKSLLADHERLKIAHDASNNQNKFNSLLDDYQKLKVLHKDEQKRYEDEIFKLKNRILAEQTAHDHLLRYVFRC